MNTVELFAGAGGMALGVECAGFHHNALLEFDAAACETLCLNRPGWPVLEADVQDVDFRRYAGIDLLTAGAPCQPFSTAGMRRLDSDSRNMFPEVFRAVRTIRPRALLLENVKGMLLGDARPYFDLVVERLGELGYNISWQLINCADYGVPQRRERVFLAGFRRDLRIRWAWPTRTHGLDRLLYAKWGDGSYWHEHRLPEPCTPPLKQIQGLEQMWPSRLPPPRRRWCTVRDALADPDSGLADSASVQASGGTWGDPKVNVWDEPAKTITTRWDKALLRERDGALRHLTIRELARLQSFCDGWVFTGQPDVQLRQVGNAVPVAVAHALAGAIAERLRMPEDLQSAA